MSELDALFDFKIFERPSAPDCKGKVYRCAVNSYATKAEAELQAHHKA